MYWKTVYRTVQLEIPAPCMLMHALGAVFYLLIARAQLILARDVLPQTEKYTPDYNLYHNLSRIQLFVEDLVQRNPNYIQLDNSYISRQNQRQLLLRITNFTDGQRRTSLALHTHTVHVQKTKVLFSFGEHAREFFPVESLFYLLHNLTRGLTLPEKDPSYQFTRMVLSQVDLFIVVMMNPDGRRYVENTGNYCWRGTSTGVDLNRNFDWAFGEKGSSADTTDEEYRGTGPFSEPECLVLLDLTSRFQFDAFASFHSGIRQIYVPFADTLSKKKQSMPDNIESMMELAQLLSTASKAQPFKFGLAYQLNDYTADGTIFDYMAGIRKIPFSFAIELWGDGDSEKAKCFDLFNPTNQQLEKAVQDIHPIYVTFLTHLVEWKQAQAMARDDLSNDAPSLTFGLILLGTVIILFVLVLFHNRMPSCVRIFPRKRVVSLRALSSTFSVARVMVMKP